MSITKKDVEHVARLAKLALTEEEKENLTSQLGNTLQYIDKLKELDTTNIEPTAHPSFSKTVWREDKTIKWGDPKPLLDNAPESEESFFKVKKVIE